MKVLTFPLSFTFKKCSTQKFQFCFLNKVSLGGQFWGGWFDFFSLDLSVLQDLWGWLKSMRGYFLIVVAMLYYTYILVKTGL